jgi:hypothetical protein
MNKLFLSPNDTCNRLGTKEQFKRTEKTNGTKRIVDKYCAMFGFEDNSSGKNILLSMANEILDDKIKILKL